MLRLDLKRKAAWVELGHGVRVKCEPLTTGVMAAAKRDFGDMGITEESSQEEIGIAMAKAVARRVIVEWDGVADEEGNPAEVTPEGIDALLDIWVIFDAFQSQYLPPASCWTGKKTASRPRRMALRRGRRLLRGLQGRLRGVPGQNQRAANSRG